MSESIIGKLGITPGPWRDSEGYGRIFAKRVGGCTMTEQNMTVAQVRGWGCLQYHGHDKAVAEQDANEKLIAAAPEMLEALMTLRYKADIYDGLSSEKFREEHTAIIEKATGRTWEEIKEML